MSLARLMSQPLTVQAWGVVGLDTYGGEIMGAVGDPVPVTGYLEQLSTVEFTLNRDTTVTKWQAYLPAGTEVTPLSYINYLAQKFQVDGEPWLVWNPRRGATSHIQCKLLVISG